MQLTKVSGRAHGLGGRFEQHVWDRWGNQGEVFTTFEKVKALPYKKYYIIAHKLCIILSK